MEIRVQGAVLWLMLCAFVPLAQAQSGVTPEDEYKKLIRVSEEIQPLGENPFGEQVSLYNGSLSFAQTDVSLAGNGPLLQVSRSFHPADKKESGTLDGGFADWDLEIPRITTLAATQWLVAGTSPRARCSQFGPPPTIAGKQGGAAWEPTTWWSGYQLVVPGQGSQDLLRRAAQNPLSPSMGGSVFGVVTTRHWMITCGVATDDPVNDPGGEGFLAVAPDGTRYWFTHLVYRWAPTMHRPIGAGPLGLQSIVVQPNAFVDDYLTRRQATMLVTRIEDRFGNSLTYSYNGAKLTAITASDGRQVNLTYLAGSDRVGTISVAPASGPARTWSYQYSTALTPLLSKVTLPDGSAWSYNLAGLRSGEVIEEGGGDCDNLGAVSSNVVSGSIVHPSGLTGTFQIKPVVRGRSYVPRQCVVMALGSLSSYAYNPRTYAAFAIIQKTFSGAGVPSQTWSYSYSPANASWSQDCAGGCASTVWTDVVDPEGHAVRSTFSNRFNETEGQLQRVDSYSGAIGSSLLRSEANLYAASTTGAWPSVYGYNLQSRMNLAVVQQVAPLSQRTITQDGDTYTWQATAFDAYGQVTRTKRFNSISGQAAVEEQTTYLNDLPHWVLGLPTETKNLTTGEVVDKYVYDLSKVTLKEHWRFGQKRMSYTFNAAGQLASFTDGNGHATTLGSYKRGIPQAIGYPDGTTQNLAVDDLGQITAITDQAGSQTSYSYDAIGRLAGITYPSGDEQNWWPQSFAYAWVTSAEQGVPANHWRRTVSQGSARTVTYFDALLRPVLTTRAIDGMGTSSSTRRTAYDWKGRTVFASYPVQGLPTLGAVTAGVHSAYDALGRLIQTQQSSELGTLTTTTAYLSQARVQVTDPKGNVTTTSHQVFDQPAYEAPIKIVAPAGLTQVITRDLYGNPLAITQSGVYGTQGLSVEKTFAYDSAHRLCRSTEPESGSTVMAYDAAGNLAWRATGLGITGNGCGQEQVAAAAKTMHSYDALNRLLTVLPPAGTQSTSYTYDALGRLKTAVSGISTWSATYNKRGLPMVETMQLAGQYPWTLNYTHDAYGHLAAVQYPDGENVGYAPDALGRATRVGNYLTGIGYFANDEVAQATLGNGALYVAEQNARQLPGNFSYGRGAVLDLSEDMAYDKNGNPIQITDLAGGPRSKTLGYDALDRLTSAQATALWGTETYTYDPINNLRQRVNGSQATTWNYDSRNRLSSLSGATAISFAYDARGNVTSKGGVALNFDAKNQLLGLPGMAYAYDAAGRRISKTPTGGTPTYSFYNQAGQLMYQVEPGQARSTSYAYLGRKLVGSNESIELTAPGAISFSANPNDGSYTVSWGPAPGASSYTLQEKAGNGSWATIQTGSGTSKALSGKAGGSYTYQVRGCIGGTCGPWAASATLGVRPALPTVTVPAGTVNGNYTVSWSAPAGSTGYDIQERPGTGAWTTIASNTTATSISRPGTTSGSYTYRVSAKNSYGTRGWATSAAVTVDTTYGVLPATPAGFTVPAASNTGGASLGWSAVALATRYVVQQSGNGGTSWSGVYDGGATSTALSGLANGSYTFRVQACNSYGCSAWRAGSATLVVTHPPASAPAVTTPAGNTTGSYTVSWTAISTATSYTLQEKIGNGSWATVQAGSATSKAISGKGNGSYGYRAQACNAGGCGAWSAAKTTSVLLKPAAPASITVPATSSGSIAVSWAASATATSYTLQQRLGTGSWSNAYTGAATSSTRTVTTSGSYTYQVQACNASGCSAYKASSATTVTIPPASAPALTAPASSTTGSYTLSWTAVAGATSYTLQEKVGSGSWSTIQTGGTTSKAISGKGNGSYGYRAQACNVGGCGAWSAAKTVGVTLIPVAPGSPSLSLTGPSYKPVVHVSWAAMTGVTSYQVEGNHPQEGVATYYNGPNTTFSQLIYATGQMAFRVKACIAAGCSGWSGYSYISLNSGAGSGVLLKQPAEDSRKSADKDLKP